MFRSTQDVSWTCFRREGHRGRDPHPSAVCLSSAPALPFFLFWFRARACGRRAVPRTLPTGSFHGRPARALDDATPGLTWNAPLPAAAQAPHAGTDVAFHSYAFQRFTSSRLLPHQRAHPHPQTSLLPKSVEQLLRPVTWALYSSHWMSLPCFVSYK